MPRHPFYSSPGADPARVLELRALDWKEKEIADHLGVSRAVVHGILRTAGGRRPPYVRKPRPLARVHHKNRDVVLRLWDGGWGIKRLSFELRERRTAIRRELRALGAYSGAGRKTPPESYASALRTALRIGRAGPLLPFDWDGQAPFALYPSCDRSLHFPLDPAEADRARALVARLRSFGEWEPPEGERATFPAPPVRVPEEGTG